MKRFTTAALALTTLAFVPCSAQEAPERSAAAKARIAKADADRAALHPVATLNFQGGTLAAFVQELRRVTPSVNVIMPELAKQVMIPAMALNGAPIGATLDAVARLRNPRFEIQSAVLQTSTGNRPVFSLFIREIPNDKEVAAMRVASQKTIVKVFSIRRLIDAIPTEPKAQMFSSETVLSAIDAGVAAAKGGAASIKYHESTRIVIISGSVEQVAVTQEILVQLDKDIGQQYIDLHEARLQAQRSKSSSKTNR